MASRIKKVRVLQKDLPPLDSETLEYRFRYRVKSSAGESHWSPVVTLKPEHTYVPGTINVDKPGAAVVAVWDAVTIKKIVSVTEEYTIKKASEYDVWVRWHKSDAGDWSYRERITTTSIQLNIPTTYTINGVDQATAPNRLDIEVYLKGAPIVRTTATLTPGAAVTGLKVYQYLNKTV